MTAGLAGIALAIGPVMPAAAETVTLHDKVGDSAGHRVDDYNSGDITSVRVRYGPHRLRVTIAWPATGSPEHYQDLYVDTRRKESRPDLLISSNGDWEGWATVLRSHWGLDGGRSRCSGGAGSAAYDYAHRKLTYSVPVRCLMSRGAVQPQRLRVSLVTRTEQDRNCDWAPRPRHFSRWIHWQ